MPIVELYTTYTVWRQGFTLIELSIVLIIIGLIVGGVLVTVDMIHAVKLQKQISQIQEYKAAMQTFEAKYSCVAGDCSDAVDFGLGTLADRHNGNGNGEIGTGRIEGCMRGWYQNSNMAETMNVFMHLQKAELIKDDQQFEGYNRETHNYCLPYSLIEKRQPRSMLDKDAFVFPGLIKVAHYSMGTYGIHLREGGRAFGVGGIYPHWKFKPRILTTDAMFIDEKIDDGLPLTGNVGLAPTGAPWGGFIPKATTGGGHNCIKGTYKAIIDSCAPTHGGDRALLVFLNAY